MLFSVFSLFPPYRLLQPQYKSTQKTMWALAVAAVNFEVMNTHQTWALQELPVWYIILFQDLYYLSILQLCIEFWDIPPNNMTLESIQTYLCKLFGFVTYVSSEIRLTCSVVYTDRSLMPSLACYKWRKVLTVFTYEVHSLIAKPYSCVCEVAQ